MMNRLGTFLIGILVAGFMLTGIGDANTGSKKGDVVEIRIDISSQTMAVDVNGWPYGRWKVSTARSGYHTPRGAWRPYSLKKMHYSRKYDNSPMPHSIFFLGGYAIHGTGYVEVARPSGIAWLHPSASAECLAALQSRQEARDEVDSHRHHQLTGLA